MPDPDQPAEPVMLPVDPGEEYDVGLGAEHDDGQDGEQDG